MGKSTAPPLNLSRSRERTNDAKRRSGEGTQHRPLRKAARHTRNATATRAAILASAVRTFAARGYDGAGVRQIAAGAGVTAMLVNRYFGSKQKLFAEVVAATMATPVILSDQNLAASNLGARMAQALVAITAPGAPALDGFQILLHSASSEAAAKIGRAQIDKRYQKLLTTTLKGPHASERAALVFALVLGVQFFRQTMALPALAKATPTTLTTLLTPLFEQLVEHP